MNTALTTAASTAAEYLAAGLSVIPIKTDGSKAPAVSSWKSYQSRLPTENEVTGWFQHHVGIAIVYGRVSANAELIDIDKAELFQAYREQCERMVPGVFDRLTLIKTPLGYHLVYRCCVSVVRSVETDRSDFRNRANNNGR